MIKRDIYSKIQPFIDRNEIIILNGARQVGKTTLLQFLKKEAEANGKETAYFNAENPNDHTLLANYTSFVNSLQLPRKTKLALFIDEVQLLPDPSTLLKLLYDEHKTELKVIVSGSAQLEMKAKLQDSLVGRKVTFWITPFTLREFLSAKHYAPNHNPITAQQELVRLLNEYLLYGGLPQVVLTEDPDIKQRLLFEYVSTYINKDIRHLIDEENLTKFNHLNIYLSKIIGNLKNISKLSQEIQIHPATMNRYLDLLRYSFVYSFVPPYITNEISRIRKSEKIYMFDLGVRNALLSNFLPMGRREDVGALFENCIYNELRSVFYDHVYYVRSQQGNEIDFVTQNAQGEIVLFEVKYSQLENRSVTKGAWLLAKKIKHKKLYIVNLQLRLEKDNNTRYIDVQDFVDELGKITT